MTSSRSRSSGETEPRLRCCSIRYCVSVTRFTALSGTEPGAVTRRGARPRINSHTFDDVLRGTPPHACYHARMFTDRQEAGERLARALAKYRGQRPLVAAIPRGAVVPGRAVADALDGEL